MEIEKIKDGLKGFYEVEDYGNYALIFTPFIKINDEINEISYKLEKEKEDFILSSTFDIVKELKSQDIDIEKGFEREYVVRVLATFNVKFKEGKLQTNFKDLKNLKDNLSRIIEAETLISFMDLMYEED